MGKVPSAVIPVVMSLAALLLALVQLALNGMTPQPHPDAIGCLWLLLLLAQVPVIAVFAVRWMRRLPREALTVLLVQLLAAGTALVPLRFLGW